MNKCKFCFKECKGKFCDKDCKELYYFRKKIEREDLINSGQEEIIEEQDLLKQEKREQKRLIRREKENLKLQIIKQKRDNNAIILKNFNNIRSFYNLKLADVSNILGISRQAVSSWSNIKYRIPKARIEELSKALDIPVEQFYEGIEGGSEKE